VTSFPLPASSKRLPLPYIAALAGLAAVTSATLVLVVATTGTLVLTAREEWVMQTFPTACALAAIVAIVLGLPLHALLRVSGLTGRWVYVAATFIIVGGPYLWLLGPALLRADTSTPAIAFLLVPAAALPGGLLFQHLAHRARSVPPFEIRDAFIIATWVAALLFLVTPYSIPVHVDDHRGRILQAAHDYGLAAFMLLGILAGLARLWSWRVSLFVITVAWFIPIAFAVMWYFRTPVGLYVIE
jgi:hypothetical protein